MRVGSPNFPKTALIAGQRSDTVSLVRHNVEEQVGKSRPKTNTSSASSASSALN